MFDIQLPEFSNGRLSKSRQRQNPAIFGHWNTDGAGIRQHLATVVECWRIKFRPKLVEIRPTCSSESDNGDQTLPDFGGSCIFTSPNSFMRTKCQKVFSRTSFFLKMISSKIFYDKNHFTSKQTEH
jgi:hypothetical protein